MTAENSGFDGPPHRSTWGVPLALALVYISWGTTFFAIKQGVQTLPPGLFGGVRVALAGAILLAYVGLSTTGRPIRLSELLWAGVSGAFLFIGGNGLLTVSQRTTDSGFASVLAASSPIFLAALETAWPWGERLTARGWLGLLSGVAGVLLLVEPRVFHAAGSWDDVGPLLVLGSALFWAIGSFVARRRAPDSSHLAVAAYQMLLGGAGLTLIGLALGELNTLRAEQFTVRAIVAFFYLLIVGSLVGFVAYNWLLRRTSAAIASTYAYVNPVVAILVGWLLGGEVITLRVLSGMIVILGGVALVRAGGVQDTASQAAPQDTAEL